MMHLLRCACQCFVQFCSYIETLLWNIPLYSCIKLPPGPVLVTPVSFIGQMFALTHLKPGWRGQRSRCSHPYSGSQQKHSLLCCLPSTKHTASSVLWTWESTQLRHTIQIPHFHLKAHDVFAPPSLYALLSPTIFPASNVYEPALSPAHLYFYPAHLQS